MTAAPPFPGSHALRNAALCLDAEWQGDEETLGGLARRPVWHLWFG
jgi:hypothetical protein